MMKMRLSEKYYSLIFVLQEGIKADVSCGFFCSVLYLLHQYRRCSGVEASSLYKVREEFT